MVANPGWIKGEGVIKGGTKNLSNWINQEAFAIKRLDEECVANTQSSQDFR